MTGAADPVSIPGLTFVRTIGSGGHAEVHLCLQELPRRQVAVKILRETIGDAGARAAFERETGVLGALSAHPSIVTIHHAAVRDDGHPYLVMEYCSQGTLDDRIRQRTLSVPELLQTMIRLAGAVETAHRVGVLHRDIKPANVLMTEYGWPALADFGIAALPGSDPQAGEALSVPWAAPEVVSRGDFDERSDVYALAATAHTLLTGASPFAVPGASDLPGLVRRILGAPVPEIAREDVPTALRLLIAQGLAKDPADRPPSASAFARGLQRIEQDMRLPGTHLDVPGAMAHALAEDGESTRLVRAREPLGPPEERTRLARRAAAPAAPDAPDAPDDRTELARRPPVAPDDRTELARRPARTPPDDGTRLSVRADVPDADDRTRIAHRPGPAPAEDRTRIAARPAASAPGTAADAAPAGRVAYAPGQGPAPQAVYRPRATPAAVPVERAPAPPPAPRAPEPHRAPRARRRIPVGVVVVAVVAGVLVIAAAVAAVVVAMM